MQDMQKQNEEGGEWDIYNKERRSDMMINKVRIDGETKWETIK